MIARHVDHMNMCCSAVFQWGLAVQTDFRHLIFRPHNIPNEPNVVKLNKKKQQQQHTTTYTRNMKRKRNIYLTEVFYSVDHGSSFARFRFHQEHKYIRLRISYCIHLGLSNGVINCENGKFVYKT